MRDLDARASSRSLRARDRCPGRRSFSRLCGLGLAALLAVASVPAAAEIDEADLTSLDIEDLFDLEVTSLSKKSQRFTEAAAAIYVVSSDDIRRSGMRSIPEILRLVPGLQVARLSNNRWAISSRGFGSLFSDKMLVMIDGRSVYTPLFAGVYWDTVDTLLEDIDRIEVIRGPGGTLWGANAVNGVINIVTKNAKDTEGVLVTGGAGNIDRYVAGRGGIQIGDDLAVRGYAKYYNNADFKGGGGLPSHDDTDQGRGGFRLDWTPTDDDHLSVSGDLYKGDSDATVNTSFQLLGMTLKNTDTKVRGAHILGRYTHVFDEGNDAAIQMYYDRTERDDAMWEEWRNTFDLDLQHRFPLPLDSEVVWGLGYRYTDDDVDEGVATFSPDSRDENLYTGFVQGEIPLLDDMLRLTAGTKLEHNDHTGWEYQPSVRAAVIPNESNTVWAAVTRAVRTPARSNDNIQINQVGGIPVPDAVTGNPDSRSEKVWAYELGYRVQPMDAISFDVSAYYNDYDDLQTLEVRQLFPGTDIQFDNKMTGEGWGVEVYGSWRVLEWWKMQAWYTYADLNLDLDNDSQAAPLIPLGSEAVENGVPNHSFQIRSSMDLPYDTTMDVAFWWVDKVKALDIGAYERLDLRLAWMPIESLELAFVGQNLTQAKHQEWAHEFGYEGTRIPRTFYGALTWKY
jgi:iron complex outermembrane receptor protein